ncbi:hypothetical protein D3C77_434980 [compost metagenome]
MQIPLIQITPQPLQKLQLLRQLHPFGNHRQIQAPGHGYNGADDLRIVGVLRRIAHKRLVDLQRIHRQALEVGQRRIPGTEIIHGKAHPITLELTHLVDGVFQVLDDDTFGDL